MLLKKYFGPSTLVAAAFIGPGTLTTCTMAGVQTGYALLWAMGFSVIATVVLQEMSARLGFITRQGLGEAINRQFVSGISRFLVFFLVIGAILVGNAAYEAGNISGGVLGMHLIVGEYSVWPLVLGGLSFGLLYFGKYKLIERVLIGLVILMSVCFLLTAIMVQPDLGAILRGFVPSGINDHFLLIMGLIGTTVVPYNLFLHASTISKKWDASASLRDVRIENRVAIILGGLISMMIIITAAASSEVVTEVNSAKDLAVQLEPLFGRGAKWLMGIGLLAAGLSSTLTAPMAAAYAAAGLFGWGENLVTSSSDVKNTGTFSSGVGGTVPSDAEDTGTMPSGVGGTFSSDVEDTGTFPSNVKNTSTGTIETDLRFRLVWMMILFIGVLVAMMGWRPVLIIKFAQVTNALLLPLIAGYLLYIVNSKKLLGEQVNSRWTNLLGALVIGVTVLLSLKTIYLLLGG